MQDKKCRVLLTQERPKCGIHMTQALDVTPLGSSGKICDDVRSNEVQGVARTVDGSLGAQSRILDIPPPANLARRTKMAIGTIALICTPLGLPEPCARSTTSVTMQGRSLRWQGQDLA